MCHPAVIVSVKEKLGLLRAFMSEIILQGSHAGHNITSGWLQVCTYIIRSPSPWILWLSRGRVCNKQGDSMMDIMFLKMRWYHVLPPFHGDSIIYSKVWLNSTCECWTQSYTSFPRTLLNVSPRLCDNLGLSLNNNLFTPGICARIKTGMN